MKGVVLSEFQYEDLMNFLEDVGTKLSNENTFEKEKREKAIYFFRLLPKATQDI